MEGPETEAGNEWLEPVGDKTYSNLQYSFYRYSGRNSSAEALKEKLEQGPVTIRMEDYGRMEKVGTLDFHLPTNDEQITAKAGDLILYLGNSFVIYYDSNSWRFTRLGRIDNVTPQRLKKALGRGDVTVTLSLEENLV